MKSTELVKKNVNGLVAESVDAIDSKSIIFGCGSSSLPEATISSSYQLHILDSNGLPDLQTKKFCSTWLATKRNNLELSQKIESDSIHESDLFFLKNYLKDLFIMNGRSFKIALNA